MPERTEDVTPLRAFLDHPLVWWSGLSPISQFAVGAFLLGVCVIGVVAFLGFRGWWRTKDRVDWPREP